MGRSLALKIAIIGALMLMLLVPLAMIGHQIAEREQRQRSVAAEIANTSAGDQAMLGPLLVVPWKERVLESPAVNDSPARYQEVDRMQVLYPEVLAGGGKVEVGTRQRGLFRVREFRLQGRFTGKFRIPANWGIPSGVQVAEIGVPYVSVALSDVRGLTSMPEFRLAGSVLAFDPGARFGELSGIHAPVAGLKPEAAGTEAPFEFALRLQGTGSLRFLPAGRSTEIQLQSDWPHPSFVGQFLPPVADRTVSDQGFRAKWQVSHLASDLPAAVQRHKGAAREQHGAGLPAMPGFGVTFVDPVSIYVLADRAVKYGALFIVLSFAAFFFYEVLRRWRIHPMQYGLVGLALAVFYLLLVSLSEHIAFGWAYLVATIACVGLIGYYLSAVLKSARLGIGFGAALGALYGVLYGILCSEDNAFLMGALLLFGGLAAAMVLTRRIDWYQLEMKTPPTAAPPEARETANAVS